MPICSLLLCATFVLPRAAAEDGLRRVRIETEGASQVAAELIAAGFDVLRPTVRGSSLELIASTPELAALGQRGLKPVTLAVGRPFREIQAAGDGPPGYPDLADVMAQMNGAASAFPAICEVVDLTARYGVPATFEGRHMFAAKISDNVAQDENEPAFLLVSDHHARETVTPVIALHTIEQLTQQYGLDPQITALVDEYEIWIAPVWNPDGYNWVFEGDNFWRKNRRVFPQGIGVDQNRNYPFGWESACSGSTDVTSQTYRGPSPASEAETQTMIAWAEDRRFAKVADMHSFGREVRSGFGCFSHPFTDFWTLESDDLAAVSGYVAASSCCTGGNIHYHTATKGAHAFLWETHSEFQPLFASAQDEAAVVFPSVLAFLERPISVSGRVTDARTGEALVADIRYAGVVFENGEINESGGPLGRYHATLPPANYTLEFSADGYNSETRPVSVTTTSAEVLDVELTPMGCAGDLDGDGDTDLADLGILLADFGCAAPGPCAGDLDGDGDTDLADLGILLADFGCGP